MEKNQMTEVIEKFISDVLAELNNIADDENYYFNRDNANLVSSVLYEHFEELKEQK